MLFRRLGAQMRALVTEALIDRDLSSLHFLALGCLDGPRPMGAVAECLGMDASSVTMAVDRLEALGLVERRTDPSDRRVRLIAITETGRELRAQVHADVADRSPILQALDDGEIDVLVRLMRKAVG